LLKSIRLSVMLDILYHDSHLIAINKPHGLLVHPSYIARDVDTSAMQELRNQIGQYVYPTHRIDRKTGGVLLFALDKDTERLMQQAFSARQMDKTYWAIVRGFAPTEMTIDYPLLKENGTLQDALTEFKTLHKAEINLPFGKHATSRYSLVEAKPITGRTHQLRRHLAHINHPIIADRPLGCNKQNKLWLDRFNLNTMMLHAKTLRFVHPHSNKNITLEAPLQSEFARVMQILEMPI
jgi:tRNA pseudouridine65 synthase